MTVSSSTDTSSVRIRRFTVVAVASSVALFFGLVATSLTNETFGIDFGVFHAGGDLIGSSGFDAAYDTRVFSEHFQAEYFPSTQGRSSNTHFISTPTFGWVMQAVTFVRFDVALVAWLVLGALMLLPAVALLGLPRWAALALAISPAMAMNTVLGQTGPYVLVLFVLLHRSLSDDNLVRSGLLAGLLILKPPLALGYGVFWLVSGRRHATAMVVAVCTGVVLSIPTLLGGVSPWTRFLETMQDRAETEGSWSQQSQSLPEFLKLAMPASASTVTVIFWIAGVLAAVALAVAAERRFAGDAELYSAAAVVTTIVASPHLLIYDSFILVIPVAVGVRRGFVDAERAATLAAIIAATIAFGPVLYDLQRDLFGRGIGLEFPGLVACVVLLVRWASSGGHDLSSEQPDAVEATTALEATR